VENLFLLLFKFLTHTIHYLNSVSFKWLIGFTVICWWFRRRWIYHRQFWFHVERRRSS
jgi:hypothetical protein